jgi:hypothetical protein
MGAENAKTISQRNELRDKISEAPDFYGCRAQDAWQRLVARSHSRMCQQFAPPALPLAHGGGAWSRA